MPKISVGGGLLEIHQRHKRHDVCGTWETKRLENVYIYHPLLYKIARHEDDKILIHMGVINIDSSGEECFKDAMRDICKYANNVDGEMTIVAN
ncbi:hypothetical protein ISN45_At05g046300 [Arabidopsis thaliana x Arabidopsis arenosa]|uniref:Uncharacterized protein n=3 Tax=Arabidopsis TaxID=3701 RepID=Q9FI60_ARATH|nr:hypothetical protein ISN45_At05g046300 [Arabidopsis thaliana x Arabidopsis arenosa]KAG7612558.1 hypothetical protein ISN44_As05g045660 [Arabidopsis suecica]BAB08734.1 unnamed protein product [Arabidopsis thaliana]